MGVRGQQCSNGYRNDRDVAVPPVAYAFGATSVPTDTGTTGMWQFRRQLGMRAVPFAAEWAFRRWLERSWRQVAKRSWRQVAKRSWRQVAKRSWRQVAKRSRRESATVVAPSRTRNRSRCPADRYNPAR